MFISFDSFNSSLNELTFTNRNKLYGAYSLRENYNKRMSISMFLSLIIVFFFFLWFATTNKSNPIVESLMIELPNEVFDPIEESEVPALEAAREHAQPISEAASSGSPEQSESVVSENQTSKIPILDILTGNQGKVIGALGSDTSLTESRNINQVDLNKTQTKENANGSITEAVLPPTDHAVDFADEMPSFGKTAADLKLYLAKNIKYPDIAKEQEIEGQVNISFVVLADGSISEPQIIKSLHPSLDHETIRVIRSMPKWKPGKKNGKAVPVRFRMPVKFLLER
ncbi:MAG TPA: energy transducer TonB [Saprospiraceae bacterium]|nr:energy transducer TonB [Saprospiraceae bacterium]